MWAYPKDGSAKEKMRSVYKDYNLAQSKAKKLKAFVDEEFEFEKMHNKLLESINFPTNEDEILEYV